MVAINETVTNRIVALMGEAKRGLTWADPNGQRLDWISVRIEWINEGKFHGI